MSSRNRLFVPALLAVTVAACVVSPTGRLQLLAHGVKLRDASIGELRPDRRAQPGATQQVRHAARRAKPRNRRDGTDALAR